MDVLSHNKRYEGFENRLYVVAAGIVLVLSVLVVQLWDLQVVHYADYQRQAESNRLHSQRLEAPRGIIYGPDESIVLADNRPSCDLVIVPAECGKANYERVCRQLASLLNLDEAKLIESVTTRLVVKTVPAPEEDGDTKKTEGEAKAEKIANDTGDTAGSETLDTEAAAETEPKKKTIKVTSRINVDVAKNFRQIAVKKDVSKDEIMRVEEYSHMLPGVFTVARPQRRYLQGKTASQILGYLGPITENELAEAEEQGVSLEPDTLLGRAGIERSYDEILRGKNGELVVSVYAEDQSPQLRTDVFGMPQAGRDSYGRQLSQEFYIKPTPGTPIHLTLDMGLQRHCEQILSGQIGKDGVVNESKVGGIAVLNADTGEVLALASTPTYDPNIFLVRSRGAERAEALGVPPPGTDPNIRRPSAMTNRCYRERYAPGSVFKVFLAASALEESVIDQHTTFSCPGFFQLPGVERKWACWNHYGHGGVNVVDSLAFSCDVFFYNVGLKLGVDRITEWAHKFGLGEKTGIDLPMEVEGLIPSRAYRLAQQKKFWPKNPSAGRWYDGYTVNLAIGQGEACTTPLQNAVMMAAIVNGGRRVRPYVNKDLRPEISEPFLSESTLNIVRMGMRKCIEKGPPAPTGTGNAAAVQGMTVIGKTGTAQVAGVNAYKGLPENQIPMEVRDNAWFVAGVLNQEPRIAMCILVEHGLHGSSTAAPLAKEVIEYFYGSREDAKPATDKTPVAVAKEEAAHPEGARSEAAHQEGATR